MTEPRRSLSSLVHELATALGDRDAVVLGLPVALDLRWRQEERGLFLSGVPADVLECVGEAFAVTIRAHAVVAEWWSVAPRRGVGTGPVLTADGTEATRSITVDRPTIERTTKLEQAAALRAQFGAAAARLERSLADGPDAGVLLAALDGEPQAAAGVLDDLATSRDLVGRFLLDAADELDDERIDQLGDGYVRAGSLWQSVAHRREPDAVDEAVDLERSCVRWMLGAAEQPTRYAF